MGIYGTIMGDIAGSRFEFYRPKNLNVNHINLFADECDFTDDTVLAVATKWAIINKKSFTEAYRKFGRQYPHRGYGGRFESWLYTENPQPYNSYGNGSAMRVAYVADHFNTEKEVLEVAKESAIVTHNHPEGIKGAQVTALCSYMARTGASKKEIEEYAKKQYGTYYFENSEELIRSQYQWNEICQDSVPLAIRCFVDSNSYDDFLRKVISYDCDTDTICAIGGCIAENYYKGTGHVEQQVLKRYLTSQLFRIAMD